VHSLDPPLRRDKRKRRKTAENLDAARAKSAWPDEQETADTPAEAGRIEELVKALRGNLHTLNEPNRQALRALAAWLEERGERKQLQVQLRDVADTEEEEEHPNDAALEFLVARQPAMIEFHERERNLRGQYDLEDPDDLADPAFNNLASLAGLDIAELRRAVTAGETGTQADLRRSANEELRQRFAEWRQRPPIHVEFDNHNQIVNVHVRSGSGPSMPIRERSDGLRQFVALVALTAKQKRHPVPPILVIDEVETHLHYDAQADLLRILAAQSTASQVIYSTHSAACLPEDIGASVRIVEGIDDRTASRVRQHFWTDRPGIGPLLMAMGAASMAFVPLRPALITEGPTDFILLGSLFMEATSSDELGFQIAPGSSHLRAEQIAGLDLEAPRTAWIVDGDQGGKDRIRQLRSHGIPPSQIMRIVNSKYVGFDVEDLIDPDSYCRAVTEYARDVGSEAVFGLRDLPTAPCRRHRTVELWCSANSITTAPSKTAIANKVLDGKGEFPLCDPRKTTLLRRLYARTRAALGLDPL
jgi:hypothetical protein